MFALLLLLLETRNNKHLNTQGRLHQQPRKDPVKRLIYQRNGAVFRASFDV
jgi:hypothetical protein